MFFSISQWPSHCAYIIVCMTLSNGGSSCQTLRDKWMISILMLLHLVPFHLFCFFSLGLISWSSFFFSQPCLMCHLIWMVIWGWQILHQIKCTRNCAMDMLGKWRYGMSKRQDIHSNIHFKSWSRNGSTGCVDCCIIRGWNLRLRHRYGKEKCLLIYICVSTCQICTE